MKLTILDNRDSFVWNLVHLAQSLGVEVELLEARTTAIENLTRRPPRALLVGPGPGHPVDAHLSQELFSLLPEVPMLGVCLGHQALALAHGATIESAPELAHGRQVEFHHDGRDLFASLANPACAGRYHSLTVSPTELPGTLRVTAKSAAGEVLGLAATTAPHFGVQFHPESILSTCGPTLLGNFLHLAHKRRT